MVKKIVTGKKQQQDPMLSLRCKLIKRNLSRLDAVKKSERNKKYWNCKRLPVTSYWNILQGVKYELRKSNNISGISKIPSDDVSTIREELGSNDPDILPL